jgi:uncharacterized protein YjiS (DUF1127 family)
MFRPCNRFFTSSPLSSNPVSGFSVAASSSLLALWHHRHRSRRQLAALDDRELDDIGLSRAQCQAECQKRFWQA